LRDLIQPEIFPERLVQRRMLQMCCMYLNSRHCYVYVQVVCFALNGAVFANDRYEQSFEEVMEFEDADPDNIKNVEKY